MRLFSRKFFQRLRDVVPESTVVKIAFSLLKVASEKLRGKSLNNDVWSEVSSIQTDARVRDARHRQLRLRKHLCTDRFAEKRRIFLAVVEMDFSQATFRRLKAIFTTVESGTT